VTGFHIEFSEIAVLNVRAPSDKKGDDSNDAVYDKLFDHFPKHHMKILLGDFNSKLGREYIFKPTNGNVSLHQDSDGNGVRKVKSATLK
jgi:hypothetical protein